MDRMVLLEFQFSLALVLVGEDENSKKVLSAATLFSELRLHGREYILRYQEFSQYDLNH